MPTELTQPAWRGERMREAQKTAGISVREVARIIGCSEALVWAWFASKRKVGIRELERFASLTGYPLSYFLEETRVLPADYKLRSHAKRLIGQVAETISRMRKETITADMVRIEIADYLISKGIMDESEIDAMWQDLEFDGN